MVKYTSSCYSSLSTIKEILLRQNTCTIGVKILCNYGTSSNLSGNRYFIVDLVSHRTLLLVGVVERDADGGLCNARLTILVHQLLQVRSTHLNVRQLAN